MKETFNLNEFDEQRQLQIIEQVKNLKENINGSNNQRVNAILDYLVYKETFNVTSLNIQYVRNNHIFNSVHLSSLLYRDVDYETPQKLEEIKKDLEEQSDESAKVSDKKVLHSCKCPECNTNNTFTNGVPLKIGDTLHPLDKTLIVTCWLCEGEGLISFESTIENIETARLLYWKEMHEKYLCKLLDKINASFGTDFKGFSDIDIDVLRKILLLFYPQDIERQAMISKISSEIDYFNKNISLKFKELSLKNRRFKGFEKVLDFINDPKNSSEDIFIKALIESKFITGEDLNNYLKVEEKYREKYRKLEVSLLKSTAESKDKYRKEKEDAINEALRQVARAKAESNKYIQVAIQKIEEKEKEYHDIAAIKISEYKALNSKLEKKISRYESILVDHDLLDQSELNSKEVLSKKSKDAFSFGDYDAYMRTKIGIRKNKSNDISINVDELTTESEKVMKDNKKYQDELAKNLKKIKNA
jgi:hypothetical protein